MTFEEWWDSSDAYKTQCSATPWCAATNAWTVCAEQYKPLVEVCKKLERAECGAAAVIAVLKAVIDD